MAATLSMAIEVDCFPESPFWWWWNQSILVFFCFELTVRIIRSAFKYGFTHFWNCRKNRNDCGWNYFDCTIVLMCILDQ